MFAPAFLFRRPNCGNTQCSITCLLELNEYVALLPLMVAFNVGNALKGGGYENGYEVRLLFLESRGDLSLVAHPSGEDRSDDREALLSGQHR